MIVGFISLASARLVGITPVSLSPTDKASVERVACITPHNLRMDRLDAYSPMLDAPRPLPISVTVYCESHLRTEQDSPIRWVVACENSTGAWKCGTPELEVAVEVAGQMIGVRPSGIAPDEAERIVVDIADDDLIQNDPVIVRVALYPPCLVQPDSPETWRVTCEWSEIKVTRSCADGSCEYQASEFARRVHD